jgi:hypothetical protein
VVSVTNHYGRNLSFLDRVNNKRIIDNVQNCYSFIAVWPGSYYFDVKVFPMTYIL